MALPTAPDIGPLPDVFSRQFTMPPPTQGGMFGGGGLQSALMAALAGYNARRNPGFANSVMEQLTQKQVMNRQAQLTMLRDNLEFQRQAQMAQFQAMLAQQYPTDALSVALRQSGVQPGTPQWQQAQATQAANLQDPVVIAGQYGPVLRSQVIGAAHAQPPAAPVGKLTPITDGGPTPSASGGFF